MTHSILIIDDSAHLRQEIKSVLVKAEMFDVFYEATDGMSGFKMMLSTPPDIVICDLYMPDFDGLKFLKMKKSRKEFDKIPVLIVTSMDNLTDKIHALAEGAQDYVTKPFSPPELVARVKAHFRIKLLQDELLSANEKMEMLSNNTHLRIKLLEDELADANEKLDAITNIDTLTGLYNRRFFISSLEKEFERAKSYNRPLSLIQTDMDRFRALDDLCDPLSGDKVLKAVAGILRTGLRKIDLCARFGGEEFITMLSETDESGAILVAEGYMNEMRKQDMSGICENLTSLTFSIGIACLPDNGIKDMNKFLKCAHEALNESKNAGRNRITVYKLHTTVS